LLGNFSTELADQSRPIRDRLSAHFAAWSRQIESCVRDAQKAGEVSSEVDPHVLAGFLLNSFEGAVLRMKVEKDDSPQKNFMDVIFSRVLA
jgi:TetR/AcrR family transcriptional repressor of nem operon